MTSIRRPDRFRGCAAVSAAGSQPDPHRPASLSSVADPVAVNLCNSDSYHLDVLGSSLRKAQYARALASPRSARSWSSASRLGRTKIHTSRVSSHNKALQFLKGHQTTLACWRSVVRCIQEGFSLLRFSQEVRYGPTIDKGPLPMFLRNHFCQSNAKDLIAIASRAEIAHETVHGEAGSAQAHVAPLLLHAAVPRVECEPCHICLLYTSPSPRDS